MENYEKISGARVIIECLLEQGVDTIFGYPGGQIMPFYDALYAADIKHILTVHEQGAVHAAEGYARVTGRVGVCVATSGPGATNLVTGLANAHMDSVPLVAITGQVPRNLLGRDAFQEVDIIGISMPITKHNFLVKDPAKLADTIRQAFHIAVSGRPGPVLVDIPKDVQAAEVKFVRGEPREPYLRQPSSHTMKMVEAAAMTIAQAQKPVIVVGGGVIGAGVGDKVRLLAEKNKLPMVSTLMGLGAVGASHPQFLGLTGMHGSKAANHAVYEADVVIAVGSRFNDRVTGDRTRYAAGKTVIHIDVDPTEIDKNVIAHIGLLGDLHTLLDLLAEKLQPGNTEDWWRQIRAWQEEFAVAYDDTTLNVPWVMEYINEQTQNQPYIFVTDVGQQQMWAAQHLKIEKPRTWVTSGGLGTMGFGLPAAIGAQIAEPQKRVVHIAGDGGFKMTGMELYTVACQKLPIISIVINNSTLGMVRQWQTLFFNKHYSATTLPPAMDFTVFAEAFHIESAAVTTPAEFAAAFAKAQSSDKPQLIVVNIDIDDMVMPMIAPGAALNEYTICSCKD